MNTVNNFNILYNTYCYQVLKSMDEIVEILRLPNIHDAILSDFDAETMTITFKDYGFASRCQLIFIERNGYRFLKVKVLSSSGPSKHSYYWMNPFWIDKIGAIPVPCF